MGGGISSSKTESTSLSSSSPGGNGVSLDRDKFITLRTIFRNDFAKSAYTNFLRHEEASPLFPNYFREVNFVKIGVDEDAVSSVLSETPDSNTIAGRYPSIEFYFRNVNEHVRKTFFDYTDGDCTPFLVKLMKASNFVLLLMAIDSIDRFESSKSHQKWFAREKSIVSDLSMDKSLFSTHLASKRTEIIHNSDLTILGPLLDSRDWLLILKECLYHIPIASALCKYDKNHCHVVSCNDAYKTLFRVREIDLFGREVNLLQHTDQRVEIQTIIESKSCAKITIGKMVDETNVFIALASVPICDHNKNCKYMVFICCNMSSPLFTLEELKIVSDFADILPRCMQMRSDSCQEKLFQKPAPEPRPTIDMAMLARAPVSIEGTDIMEALQSDSNGDLT